MRYVKEVDHKEKPAPTTGRITTDAVAPLESRLVINYILGGPLDDQY